MPISSLIRIVYFQMTPIKGNYAKFYMKSFFRYGKLKILALSKCLKSFLCMKFVKRMKENLLCRDIKPKLYDTQVFALYLMSFIYIKTFNVFITKEQRHVFSHSFQFNRFALISIIIQVNSHKYMTKKKN